ncbi:hypothetical protein WMY93_034035, partial [Mugilogobius chulae]
QVQNNEVFLNILKACLYFSALTHVRNIFETKLILRSLSLPPVSCCSASLSLQPSELFTLAEQKERERCVVAEKGTDLNSTWY